MRKVRQVTEQRSCWGALPGVLLRVELKDLGLVAPLERVEVVEVGGREEVLPGAEAIAGRGRAGRFAAGRVF